MPLSLTARSRSAGEWGPGGPETPTAFSLGPLTSSGLDVFLETVMKVFRKWGQGNRLLLPQVCGWLVFIFKIIMLLNSIISNHEHD